MKNTLITSAILSTSLILTACGGGGSDSAGTSGSDSAAPDTTAPIVNLIGNSTVTVEAPNTYTDEGATASDNIDGNISTQIAVVNSVDSNAIGSYSVTYNVSDAASNAANQVTRTVNVVDTTAPVITLIGDAIVTVEAGSDYVDAGATATDSHEGALTPVVSSTVDTNALGSYVVTYNISDSSGNAASQVTRTVNVESIFHVSNTAEFREALNTAATNGFDDTIILADGVYKTTDDGNGVFTYRSNEENKLTLKGSSPENAILSGDNTNPILLHTSTKDAPLSLEKLSFMDGLVNYPETDSTNGVVVSDYSVDVADCYFKNNRSDYATLEVNSNILISNSTFENNKGQLGALYVTNGFAKISNSTFIQNTNYISDFSSKSNLVNSGGGAVYIWRGGIEVISSIFEGNSSRQSGGAIFSDEANVKITDSTFNNNSAHSTHLTNPNDGSGGAIYTRYQKDVDVFNSVFEFNTSQNCGGAIYSTRSVRIESTIIANNSADEVGGAVVGDTVRLGCSGGGVMAVGSIISLNSLYAGNSSAINSKWGENNKIMNNIFLNNTQYDIGSVQLYGVGTGIVETLSNNYIDESRLTIPYFPSNNVFDELALGFIDEANGDYRLTLDSGLIDIGTTDIEGVTFSETDLDGKARISGDAIDIGPYEYQHSN